MVQGTFRAWLKMSIIKRANRSYIRGIALIILEYSSIIYTHSKVWYPLIYIERKNVAQSTGTISWLHVCHGSWRMHWITKYSEWVDLEHAHSLSTLYKLHVFNLYYYCYTRILLLPRLYKEAFDLGGSCSGVYTIKPDNLPPFDVCSTLMHHAYSHA